MLVLSRKLDEQIRIDERVTVTILRVKGNSVRIGIEAPKEVRIVRGELPPLDQGSDAAALPLKSKLPRLAQISEDPKARTSSDDRQRSQPCGGHPDRWTVANMRDRTKSERRRKANEPTSQSYQSGAWLVRTIRQRQSADGWRRSALHSGMTSLVEVLQQDALHLKNGSGMTMDVQVVSCNDKLAFRFSQVSTFRGDDSVTFTGHFRQKAFFGDPAHNIVILDPCAVLESSKTPSTGDEGLSESMLVLASSSRIWSNSSGFDPLNCSIVRWTTSGIAMTRLPIHCVAPLEKLLPRCGDAIVITRLDGWIGAEKQRAVSDEAATSGGSSLVGAGLRR